MDFQLLVMRTSLFSGGFDFYQTEINSENVGDFSEISKAFKV